MQKFLFFRFMFLWLAFLPAMAMAQWNSSGDWNWRVFKNDTAAMTYSQKYGYKVQLLIVFDFSSNCSPSLFLSQSESINDRKKPEGVFQGGFKARIDTKAPWVVNSGDANAFYSNSRTQGTIDYTIALNVKEKLILELAYGQTFRILHTHTGDTDRFRLLGSASAIGNAYQACKKMQEKSSNPDLQYFDQKPPQQQKQTPPQSNDSDRQFFR